MRLSIGRPLSPWARIAAWWNAPLGLVEHCPRCHNVLEGDLEMRRRLVRHLMSYDACLGYSDVTSLCVVLHVIWS